MNIMAFPKHYMDGDMDKRTFLAHLPPAPAMQLNTTFSCNKNY